MLKKFVFIASLAINFFSYSQTSPSWLWAVKGKEVGSNILNKPQDYIDQELNFDNLIIKLDQSDIIVAPCDGEVVFFGYGYNRTLTNSWSYHLTEDEKNNFDDVKARNRMSKDFKIDAMFISGNIGLQTANGILYLNGILFNRYIKTGEKIKRGEVLGRAGYGYYALKVPNLLISRSVKSKPTDPMLLFGLKSTFLPPVNKVYKKVLSLQDVKEDIDVFKKSLIEGVPGLYTGITLQKLDSLLEVEMKKLPNPCLLFDIYQLCYKAVSAIGDEHVMILSQQQQLGKPISAENTLPMNIAVKGDSLFIRNALPQYQQYVGLLLKSLNGEPAKQIVKFIYNHLYDLPFSFAGSPNKSMKDYMALRFAGMIYNYNYVLPKKVSNQFADYEFADGTHIKTELVNAVKHYQDFTPSANRYNEVNAPKQKIELKILLDSIAYLGLQTIELTETEVDSIASFIASLKVQQCNNLIVDVRYNGGGDEKVLTRLFEMIAVNPFKLSEYSKVNKNGTYDFFKYSLNYNGTNNIFSSFKQQEGKSGFYQINEEVNQPDKKVHYAGKVYVLVNEWTASAASYLAALVRKNNRGIIIGRETHSRYHSMNADKFAYVILPNSGLRLHVPLVQIIFDSNETSKNPKDRGLMPDYEISLTIDELNGVGGDKMLNYAMDLIGRNK